MSDTMELVETDHESKLREPGDEERFAHYVLKGDILEATVNGTPVEALCGKVWVPTRLPDKFPVCPECQTIYDDPALLALASIRRGVS